VARGLVGVDRSPADDQVAWLGRHGTVLPALGTGLDRAKALGVVSEQLLEGPAGQGLRGIDGDLLEGVERDIVGRSGVAEGAPRDDFSQSSARSHSSAVRVGGVFWKGIACPR
jgi:hypothetical protein